MERVGALINKLKEQYDQNVDKKNLVITAQLLLSELTHETSENASKEKVAVILPRVQHIVQDIPSVDNKPAETPTAAAVPEAAAPQAELPETIRSYVLKPPPQPMQASKLVPPDPVPTAVTPEAPPAAEAPAPPPPPPAVAEEPVKEIPKPQPKSPKEQSGWLFDPVQEIPTLAHQPKEIYELNDVHIDSDSLNDKLKEEKTEVAATIKGDTVQDLRRAIGINDRYRFINELFRGDEDMYERSIKTINSFSSFAEADTWIQRELKVKIGWNEKNTTVRDFDQVVKRRFS